MSSHQAVQTFHLEQEIVYHRELLVIVNTVDVLSAWSPLRSASVCYSGTGYTGFRE